MLSQIPMATAQNQNPHTRQIKAQTFGVILIIGTHWQCALVIIFGLIQSYGTPANLPTANAIVSTK